MGKEECILDILKEEIHLPTLYIYRWDLECSVVCIWGHDENMKEELQQKEQGAKNGILRFICIWSQQNLVKPKEKGKQTK